MKLGSPNLRLTVIKAVGGEPWVYFDGSSAVETYGVFRNGYQKVEGPRGPTIGGRRPELDMSTDVVAEPKQGDLLFRGAMTAFEGVFTHEVASFRPNEGGDDMVTLVLKTV
jgi:hypothetical protein